MKNLTTLLEILFGCIVILILHLINAKIGFEATVFAAFGALAMLQLNILFKLKDKSDEQH